MKRLPSREELVAFIRERSGKVGVREIARAFGAKNADRAALNRMLRELADQGSIDRRRKRLHHPGTLPPVVLADITGRDGDGELLARPTEWDEQAHGAPPVIRLLTPRRARPGEVAGVGDRALIRIEERGDEETSGRVIKLIDRARQRTLGIFRGVAGGGGRLVPVDKKQLGRELAYPRRCHRRRARRRSRRRRRGAPRPARAADRRRGRTARLARKPSARSASSPSTPTTSRTSLRAPCSTKPPPRGAASTAGREDWRDVAFVTIDPPDAKDHDDAVHAAPDADPRNAGGFIVHVAIADVAHYVRPGTALDREAAKRGNSVYFPDRVVPMLPERISNDLCSLRPHQDRPALAVRMVVGADGRKRSHSFHRVLIRSAARLHYEQAQLAVSGRTDEVTAPIAEPVLQPLYDAYRSLARARDERAPLDLDIPERKILLKSDGTVDRVIMPAAARSAPADRGVHDLRQRRRRRNLRAGQCAAHLSRARRAFAGKAQCAA